MGGLAFDRCSYKRQRWTKRRGGRGRTSASQGERPQDTATSPAGISGFRPPELCENEFLLFMPLKSVEFCVGSPSKLTHPVDIPAPDQVLMRGHPSSGLNPCQIPGHRHRRSPNPSLPSSLPQPFDVGRMGAGLLGQNCPVLWDPTWPYFPNCKKYLSS